MWVSNCVYKTMFRFQDALWVTYGRTWSIFKYENMKVRILRTLVCLIKDKYYSRVPGGGVWTMHALLAPSGDVLISTL